MPASNALLQLDWNAPNDGDSRLFRVGVHNRHPTAGLLLHRCSTAVPLYQPLTTFHCTHPTPIASCRCCTAALPPFLAQTTSDAPFYIFQNQLQAAAAPLLEPGARHSRQRAQDGVSESRGIEGRRTLPLAAGQAVRHGGGRLYTNAILNLKRNLNKNLNSMQYTMLHC